MKYKVGDKVKIWGIYFGTIKAIDAARETPYFVESELDDRGDGHFYSESSLELR